jgi:alanine dehydrogenase
MSATKPIISTSFSYETLEETLDIKPKGQPLMIGIPKETAFQENRVALTPEAVGVLVSNGHQVVLEHNAGDASHFRDRITAKPAPALYTTKRKCTDRPFS